MDNEVVIICTTVLTGKPIVFKPKAGVCLPKVFRDIGRWSIPWRECSVEDVPAEGLRAWQAEAWASVLAAIVASAASRMIAMVGSFPRVTVGTSVGIEGAACVAVVAETLMYQDCSALLAALWCLVDRCVPSGAHRGGTLASVRLVSPRHRALCLLCCRTLK